MYIYTCVQYILYLHIEAYPSKHDTLNQCRFIVGPPFPTSAQHQIGIGFLDKGFNIIIIIINHWIAAIWPTL